MTYKTETDHVISCKSSRFRLFASVFTVSSKNRPKPEFHETKPFEGDKSHSQDFLPNTVPLFPFIKLSIIFLFSPCLKAEDELVSLFFPSRKRASSLKVAWVMLNDVDDASKTFKLIQLNDYLLSIDIDTRRKVGAFIDFTFLFYSGKVSEWKITFHRLTTARMKSDIEFDKFMAVCWGKMGIKKKGNRVQNSVFTASLACDDGSVQPAGSKRSNSSANWRIAASWTFGDALGDWWTIWNAGCWTRIRAAFVEARLVVHFLLTDSVDSTRHFEFDSMEN